MCVFVFVLLLVDVFGCCVDLFDLLIDVSVFELLGDVVMFVVEFLVGEVDDDY